MKKYFFIFIILIPLACETDDLEPVYREDLVGSWVNVNNEIDTLEIDFCILRRYALEPEEYPYRFTYQIKDDSITLNFRPAFRPDFGNINCKIQFLDEDLQILSIDDLGQAVPFYPGTEFRRVEAN